MGRIRLTDYIGMELHPTPFGVCLIFFHDGLRIASLSCERHGCNTFNVEGTEVYENFPGTLLDATDKVRNLVAAKEKV
jgi:hypothetical protein